MRYLQFLEISFDIAGFTRYLTRYLEILSHISTDMCTNLQ